MAKKKPVAGNYLEKVFSKKKDLVFTAEENGIVTLQVENKGFFCWLSQKLFRRPRISYIHLDEFGSFVWQQLDGIQDLFAIGEAVEAKFGEAAHPLYPRLAQYLKTLERYGFVE